MRIVLDTNVLVSGVLTPHGPPGQLIELVLAGAPTPVVDARILAEYHEVLRRPRLKFDPAHIRQLLETLESLALHVTAAPWPHPLPDPDDEPFIAVAAEGLAILVTGNGVHFPVSACAGVTVLTPRACYELLRLQFSGHSGGVQEPRPVLQAKVKAEGPGKTRVRK